MKAITPTPIFLTNHELAKRLNHFGTSIEVCFWGLSTALSTQDSTDEKHILMNFICDLITLHLFSLYLRHLSVHSFLLPLIHELDAIRSFFQLIKSIRVATSRLWKILFYSFIQAKPGTLTGKKKGKYSLSECSEWLPPHIIFPKIYKFWSRKNKNVNIYKNIIILESLKLK